MGCGHSAKLACEDADQVAQLAADPSAADDARASAAASALLPAGSTWEEYGGVELEPLFAHTTLVRASWLLAFAEGRVMPEREGIVPAWQDVPPEAAVTLEELRYTTMFALPVAILSYGWCTRGHPDPTGSLLQKLVPTLRMLVHSCRHGIDHRRPSHVDGGGQPCEWGIVMDFMSLPQRGYTCGYNPNQDDRTSYQRARFGQALSNINVWYGHPYVTTLVCDWPMPNGAENTAPIEKRGWCVFERRLSSMTKMTRCCLLLSRSLSQARTWYEYWEPCAGERFPPLTPPMFEKMLRDEVAKEQTMAGSGLRFTNGHDATAVCIPQYEQGFKQRFSTAKKLSYQGTGWGDQEVQTLTSALLWAHEYGATTSCCILYLNDNAIADAGLESLVRALEVGVMPELREFSLVRNKISDAGARCLAAALAGGKLPKLESLSIYENQIGQEAEAALRDACLNLGVELIGEFSWIYNRISDEDARWLAAALAEGELPKLEWIGICENQIGQKAEAALRDACLNLGVELIV